jgi:hypothetical protein
MTALPHHCPRCPARWGGANTSHCAACHRTFTGVQSFDKHRGGSHVKKRYCVDPETILNQKGERVLELSKRAYPCWGAAGDKPDFWGRDD